VGVLADELEEELAKVVALKLMPEIIALYHLTLEHEVAIAMIQALGNRTKQV
jgi:coproporphyrinogen III oxidase-like Fe-S oxidoreductase